MPAQGAVNAAGAGRKTVMIIRKGTEKDIDAIEKIYDECLTLEEQGKLTVGWVRGIYPTRQVAEKSVERGDMFVQEDDAGDIVGAAVINQVQVDCYSEGGWKYPATDDEVMVIHTLIISGSRERNGFGTSFIDFYENYAKEHGCSCLRLDTNAINSAARSFYRKLGYTEAGIVPTVFNGIAGVDLVLLEKKIS